MKERDAIISVDIDGTTVHVRAQMRSLEEEVALDQATLDRVLAGISAMARKMSVILQAAAPNKASLEFEVGLALDSGQLTALFFESSGTGGMKITLEWEGGTTNRLPPHK